MIGGYGITGPGDHYIAPERRCGTCGLLLGARETSPCGKCEESARVDALFAELFAEAPAEMAPDDTSTEWFSTPEAA